MKKFVFLFFFFLSLTLIFFFVVFFSNIERFSVQQKIYSNKFLTLRKEFNQEILKTEKDIHEQFLASPFNISLIEGVSTGSIHPDEKISFTKSEHLLNFIVFDDQFQILYQLEPQKWSPLDLLNFKKKKISAIDNSLIFLIPYEIGLRKVFLTFEFNAYYFLERSLSQVQFYKPDSLIQLPQILILNITEEQNHPQNINKEIIETGTQSCSTFKRFCNLYFPDLQKRLLIDKRSYLNFSAGFLYPSNPMDVPQRSIGIFIILLFLLSLTGSLILIKAHRRKEESFQSATHELPDYLQPLTESTEEYPEPFENPSQDEEKNNTGNNADTYNEIEDTVKVEPNELADLEIEEKEEQVDTLPEVPEEIYNRAETPSVNQEINQLHREINEPIDSQPNITKGVKTDPDHEEEPSHQSSTPEKPDSEKDDSDEEINPTPVEEINQLTQENIFPREHVDEDIKTTEEDLDDDLEHPEDDDPNSALKEEYRDFSSQLVKTFFPKRDTEKTEELLVNFPHATSLLWLEQDGEEFTCKESILSDPETAQRCRISINHQLITEYLNHKKGIIIRKQYNRITLIQPWFSEAEFSKIETVFIFPLILKDKRYIFILY